jgi:CHAD domain-containing protein
VRRDAKRFAALDDAARHRLRRRIKRLRYGLELTASLWPDEVVAALLRRLQRAQQPLGDYNDTLVALAAAQAAVAIDARAWFAVGWLAARRAALLAPGEQALQRLARGRGLRATA